MYSAGMKQRALDSLSPTDADPTSVFTRVLVKNLRKPGLSLIDIATETRLEVRRLAGTVNHLQNPAYQDEIDGDSRKVVLAPGGNPQSDPPTSEQAAEPERLSPAPAPDPNEEYAGPPELKDIDLVYFQRDADEGRVIKALAGLQVEPSTRTSNEASPSNVLICGPDVSGAAVVTLGTALIKAGVEIYGVKPSLYPQYRNRITIETYDVSSAFVPLSVKDLSRLGDCRRFFKERENRLALINECNKVSRIDFSIRYLQEDGIRATEEFGVRAGEKRRVTDLQGQPVVARAFYVYGEAPGTALSWPGQDETADGSSYRAFTVNGVRRVFQRITSDRWSFSCSRF